MKGRSAKQQEWNEKDIDQNQIGRGVDVKPFLGHMKNSPLTIG